MIDSGYGRTCGTPGCTEIDGVVRLSGHAFPYLAHLIIDGDALVDVRVDLDHEHMTEGSDKFFHANELYVCERIGVHASVVRELRAADAPESLARRQLRPN